MKKTKKLTPEELFIKAFKKANREVEMERNNGMWVRSTTVHKNKKAYDRKRDKRVVLTY